MFPNEAACLRLISAILMEISKEWKIGKRYCAGKSFINLSTMEYFWLQFTEKGLRNLDKSVKMLLT